MAPVLCSCLSQFPVKALRAIFQWWIKTYAGVIKQAAEWSSGTAGAAAASPAVNFNWSLSEDFVPGRASVPHTSD